MKSKIFLIIGFCLGAMDGSGQVKLSGKVESVYTNAVLINWTQQRPIYGKAPHDALVSDGNFLGTSASAVHGDIRPVIGYETVSSKDVLLINYPTADIAEGDNLEVLASRVGVTNFIGRQLELWDAGIIPKTPEELAAMRAAQAQRMAAAEELIREQANAAQRARQAKLQAVQIKTVAWLQSLATNGDAAAQCSLGEHYLDGIGCETNRDSGIYWLQKSAAQGDVEASNKLDRLQINKEKP